MHHANTHKSGYNFEALITLEPELSSHIYTNDYGNKSIRYSNAEAVFLLNKALLKKHYNIKDWSIPKGYLCPPIPGRADYVHHLNDLIKTEENVKGLDIGVGANCIYPILGSQIYGWHMVGCDINEASVDAAKYNVLSTEGLSERIDIRHQVDNGAIFKNIIQPEERFTFTMCNPPFFTSAEEALKASARKNQNLHGDDKGLNFGGQANELYCNGGEALFIKRMIRESAVFKSQVSWFTTLVSRKETLPKLEKQLKKLNAETTIISMTQGHKESRILAWRF